jgi:hypothetical protein
MWMRTSLTYAHLSSSNRVVCGRLLPFVYITTVLAWDTVYEVVCAGKPSTSALVGLSTGTVRNGCLSQIWVPRVSWKKFVVDWELWQIMNVNSEIECSRFSKRMVVGHKDRRTVGMVLLGNSIPVEISTHVNVTFSLQNVQRITIRSLAAFSWDIVHNLFFLFFCSLFNDALSVTQTR